jgi:hypothetical protein
MALGLSAACPPTGWPMVDDEQKLSVLRVLVDRRRALGEQHAEGS